MVQLAVLLPGSSLRAGEQESKGKQKVVFILINFSEEENLGLAHVACFLDFGSSISGMGCMIELDSFPGGVSSLSCR